MRREEKTQRLTRVFYGLLLHKMFQSIAGFSVPSWDRRASIVGDALLSASPFVASESSSRSENTRKGLFGSLLQALQHSRQIEAERIFRQYSHLIDDRWHQFHSRSDVGGRNNVAE